MSILSLPCNECITLPICKAIYQDRVSYYTPPDTYKKYPIPNTLYDFRIYLIDKCSNLANYIYKSGMCGEMTEHILEFDMFFIGE